MGAGKKWSEEEIMFLARCYGRYPVEEIAIELNRSCGAVINKASTLKLTNIERKVIDGKKKCPRCEQYLELNMFDKCSAHSSGHQSYCKKCNAESKRKRREEAKINKLITSSVDAEIMRTREDTKEQFFTCKKCGRVKKGKEFYFNNKYRRMQCKECFEEQNKNLKIERIKQGRDW